MNSVELLDLARRRAHLPSDRKLAQALDLPEARVSQFRTGRRKLDGATCIKIAELIDAPPAYVMALVAAERAKDEKVAKEWRRAARLLKKSAAAVILAALTFVSGPQLTEGGQVHFSSSPSIHYAH